MTYCWTQDLPITLEIYREILADLGESAPDGLIVHVAQVMADGHLNYLDIWESQDACDRFTHERLHPSVGRALARHHIELQGGEPPRQPVRVAHVWAPGASDTWPSDQPAAAIC